MAELPASSLVDVVTRVLDFMGSFTRHLNPHKNIAIIPSRDDDSNKETDIIPKHAGRRLSGHW